MLSKNNKAVKTAHEKGYKVKKTGQVFNPEGKEILINYSYRYPRFNISLNGEPYPVKVHRLQAYQKFGDKLFGDGIEARHLNGDKRDNSRSNIDIGSRSDNMMDQPEGVRKKRARHAKMSQTKKERKRIAKKAAKAGMQKVSDEEAREIKKRVIDNAYDTYQTLAEEYGLKSKGSIAYIVNNRQV